MLNLNSAAKFSHLTSRCFVNAPFQMLRENIDEFIVNRIQPEIGLEGDVLYELGREDFSHIACRLQDAGLSCTIHSPFYEISPGAVDPYIRQVSRKKLRLAFDLIPVFKPKSIVCHLGFEENKHGYKEKEWFSYSLETWQELLEIAISNHTLLMLENTYEYGPEKHEKMLSALNSSSACFCLDVGHVLAFAGGNWQDWLPALLPRLGQLHLHDNNGEIDEHLAVCQGIFDFSGLFAYLKEKKIKPLLTLEPHQEEGLSLSLAALDKLL